MFTGNASTFLIFFKFPPDGETAEKTPFLKDPSFIPDLLSYQKRSFFYNNTFSLKSILKTQRFERLCHIGINIRIIICRT